MEEPCAKCGADPDDHYTAWENGIPVVGSYKDAPNGRICSPANEDLNASLSMTVARLGGTVEGQPTGKHNFLQRIDELRERELQIGEWEKLVRAAADQIYALGKQLRAVDLASGQTLQVLSTEMHRECQVIKGEDPLPHAGERLTEKRVGAPSICMVQTNCHGGTCGNLLPCDVHPGQHF